MSGAFSNLPDIIRRRLNQQPIGFKNKTEATDLDDSNIQILKNVRSEDLIRFGFESEFIGRLPVVVTLNDLDIEGLYQILKNPNSTVILGKKRDFKAYGIDVDFSDKALYRVAELANEEHTGARGLVSVVDRALLKYEKVLPDTTIEKFTVNDDMIENPLPELEKIMTNFYIKSFQKRFLATNGIVIIFTEEAVQLLNEQAKKDGRNLEEECANLLRDYEYGLKLLKCDEFTVDGEIG